MKRSALIPVALCFATFSIARPVTAAAGENCFLDGLAAIDDLQRCVNIFLGVQEIDICPGCACDDDEEMDISDLQAIVNCFLDPESCRCPALLEP
jgi:hypothetical protein